MVLGVMVLVTGGSLPMKPSAVSAHLTPLSPFNFQLNSLPTFIAKALSDQTAILGSR
jgi:hypothetical protein